MIVNGVLYFQIGLYGDMSVEGIYILSAFYGWYLWSYGGKNDQASEIKSLSTLQIIIVSLIIFASVIIVKIVLTTQTNSTVPLMDALTSVLNLTAQALTCLKFIECWMVWFVADLLVGGLFFTKNVSFHGIQHWLYLGMAVLGYLRWRKIKNT